MSGVEARNFDAPDETREPDKTKVEIVRMGGTSASRTSLEPGWREPVVGFEFDSQTAEAYATGT